MTYEYACTDCGHRWEAEQRISEKPLTDCPACGAAKAKRQISGGAGFILKGGGWYSDLYGSAKPKAESGGEGSKTAGTEAAKPATADTGSSAAPAAAASAPAATSSSSSTTSGS